MLSEQTLNTVKHIVTTGGVLAYPTEAVYGFGCDPFNEQAVQRLLKIKQRKIDKGLILIVSTWAQLQALVQVPAPDLMAQVKASWPGAVTWIFPANADLPAWINGGRDCVAVRMTSHPVARQICDTLDHALVSTSVNMSGQQPLRTYEAVQQHFGKALDYIVQGEVGNLARPTVIRDVLTGKTVRD